MQNKIKENKEFEGLLLGLFWSCLASPSLLYSLEILCLMVDVPKAKNSVSLEFISL